MRTMSSKDLPVRLDLHGHRHRCRAFWKSCSLRHSFGNIVLPPSLPSPVQQPLSERRSFRRGRQIHKLLPQSLWRPSCYFHVFGKQLQSISRSKKKVDTHRCSCLENSTRTHRPKYQTKRVPSTRHTGQANQMVPSLQMACF